MKHRSAKREGESGKYCRGGASGHPEEGVKTVAGNTGLELRRQIPCMEVTREAMHLAGIAKGRDRRHTST